MKLASLAASIAMLFLADAGFAHGPGETGRGEPPIGQPGDAAHVARTIEISMTDAMRFGPAEIRVKRGETVRLVAVNRGAVDHELVLGTLEELREHAEMMRRFPDMEHHDPGMVRVKPGKRAEIVWRFTQPGEVHYGCLMPGHFEAGMVGKVVVR